MPSDGRLDRRSVFTLAAAATATLVTSRAAADSGSPAPDSRYRGYSAQDQTKPFAGFMTEHTGPPADSVAAACAGPPVPAARIPDFAALTDDLGPTGYSAVETGYGQTTAGVLWVAAWTEMPGVNSAMWDWWFGWHSVDSARYKLWHPDAHLFASAAADRSAEAIPDRAKYIGNISYVDEYVGPKLQQLAIAFHDPVGHGFEIPAEQTVIFARVGSAVAPVDLGWLAHQVRPTRTGCEMRSRFYLNLHGLHIPDPAQAARAVERGAAVDPADLILRLDPARDLLFHCGQEMRHLAGFLPDLYREFRGR
ncbi:DAPG hydrolase family protein [Nocardia sp. NPDC003963]